MEASSKDIWIDTIIETGQQRSVNIWPDNPVGRGAEVMKYRF